MAVCDINKETKQVVQDLNNAQVNKIPAVFKFKLSSDVWQFDYQCENS